MSAYSVTIGGETFSVVLKSRSGDTLTFSVNDREYKVPIATTRTAAHSQVTITPLPKGSVQRGASPSSVALPPEIKAPLPGIISDIKVNVGDAVSAGGTLVVIEAMKMENPIKAPADLRVTQVHVRKGQEIPNGAVIISVEPT
jgi:biotin carboxyl carrier protein